MVVGTVPGRPPANVDRGELSELAAVLSVRGAAAVWAGGRGRGKSQMAAAYARDRIEQGCPLLMWVTAKPKQTW